MGLMVHVPINHPLQPLYRLIAGLIGAYILAFGIVGAIRNRGLEFFAQEGLPSALGLHANMAFAVLSIVVGLILLIGAVLGGNLDQRLNLVSSVIFILAGLVMLALQHTDANFLGFTPATCVVSLIIGLALLLAGLYGKVGNLLDVRLEEDFRHGQGPDPSPHPVSAPNPPYSGEDPLHRHFEQRHRNHQRTI